MYSLVSALAKPIVAGSRWQTAAIGSIRMRDLYAYYYGVKANLLNPLWPGVTLALDLKDIRSQWMTSSLTFNQMLASLGTSALPTVVGSWKVTTSYAGYADLFRAGYHVQPVRAGYAIDAPYTDAERPDLRIEHPSFNANLVHSRALVLVNGYYHRTSYDANYTYVLDGNRSRWVSGDNQIGVHSFNTIGSVTQVPITRESIYRQNEDTPLRHGIYFDVQEDYLDKTVFLVLGGYLHSFDGILRATSRTSYFIDFNNVPWRDRYYESKKYLDLSSLELPVMTTNSEQVYMDDLYSDETILRLMELSQTFLAVVDGADMFKQEVYVRPTPQPGLYIGYEKPDYPLSVGFGRMGNHWSTYEDTQWSITLRDNSLPNYNFNTNDFNAAVSIDNHMVPGNAGWASQARLIKIGHDRIAA